MHYVVPGFAGGSRSGYPSFLGGWDVSWDGPPLILTFMTDVSPLSEDERRAQVVEGVRQHNSAKIYDLIAQLEPHALGFAGPINPGVVRAYLEALKALGQLWRVFDKPEAVEAVADQVPELAASAARVEVLRMLESMAHKSGSDEPPAA